MTRNSPFDVHAMTIKSSRLERELSSFVQVGSAFIAGDRGYSPFSGKYKAVWDTGATSTCISVALANNLKLEQVGVCTSNGITGSAECRTFLISLYLPNGVVIPELEVSDCEGDIGCDVLIGMDVIGMGDFAVSNLGHTTFTYRVPSVQEIDFVTQMPNQFQAVRKEAPERNARCPCGSGKKYKNCCGSPAKG